MSYDIFIYRLAPNGDPGVLIDPPAHGISESDASIGGAVVPVRDGSAEWRVIKEIVLSIEPSFDASNNDGLAIWPPEGIDDESDGFLSFPLHFACYPVREGAQPTVAVIHVSWGFFDLEDFDGACERLVAITEALGERGFVCVDPQEERLVEPGWPNEATAQAAVYAYAGSETEPDPGPTPPPSGFALSDVLVGAACLLVAAVVGVVVVRVLAG